jgi:hypothetical protein
MKQRRHHFVWQHYLSAWCADGQLTCLRNGAAFKASTVNVAVEKDFHKVADLTAAELKLLILFVQQLPEHMRAVQLGWIRMFAAPSVLQGAFGGTSTEADKILAELRFNTEEEFHTRIENAALPLLTELRQGNRAFFSDRAGFQTFMFFLALQFVRTQSVRDRLRIALGGLKFPPGFGEVNPAHLAGALRTISATSVTTHYIMQREHCRLTMIEATGGAEFITGDQPAVNVYARASEGFTPPSKLRLYYPLSPTRALLFGDQRDDPIAEIQAADASQVNGYNSLIVSAAQHELYGTSESVLRAARPLS